MAWIGNAEGERARASVEAQPTTVADRHGRRCCSRRPRRLRWRR